jgi:hypothetical protein
MHPIIQSILAVLTAGALWEGFKFFYPELKRPIVSRIQAKKSFYQSIDPILKSASELYGKLLSLAKEDFATFIDPHNSISSEPDQNKKYIYYLFAQFWAQLEYLRLQNQYVALSKISKGNNLLKFIETFEARKYRILDRSVQRIIGEHLISGKDQKFRIMTLHEFITQLENNSSSLSKWILKLDSKLSNVHKKEIRQEILMFGIIVAALIDHFDPKHSTIRERPYYINKLTDKSKMTIKNNLFKYYLTFVKNKNQYYKQKSSP